MLRGRYLSPVFAIKIGETAIRNCFKGQLCAMRDEGIQNIGQDKNFSRFFIFLI